jgi:N-ethylmaleimide reductase
VLNSDYDAAKGQTALDTGKADAITFGRTFLANPDLPRRISEGLPLNLDVSATWYSQGPEGYIDYPAWQADGKARA